MNEGARQGAAGGLFVFPKCSLRARTGGVVGGIPLVLAGEPGPPTPPVRHWALPVTVKCARRFRCQQSSFDCVQTGTSLP
jgi:hypothetical protein